MKEYIIKRKCRICKEMSVLIVPKKSEDGTTIPQNPYYFHNPRTEKCRERMEVNSKLLGKWGNKDEISNLLSLLQSEREKVKGTVPRNFAKTGWWVSFTLSFFMGLMVFLAGKTSLFKIITLPLLGILLVLSLAVIWRLKQKFT